MRVLLGDALDGQHGVVGDILALLFSSFLGTAYGNGIVEGKVLLPEQVFHCVTVYEPFDNLVPDALLRACRGAEIAGFHQFSQGNQVIVKTSSGCCMRRRRSMDSLMWPSTCRLRAAIIALESFRSSVVRPRLSTTVSVSREKHKVNACTLVAAGSSLRPDRVE